MKILTKEIQKKLPKLGATAEKKPGEVPIIFKLFFPWGKWTAYVIEGEQLKNGDWTLFALVHDQEKEFGYLSLNELENVRGPMGLTLERDKYIKATLTDVLQEN